MGEVGSFHLRCGYFDKSNHPDIEHSTSYMCAMLRGFIGSCDHFSDAVEAHFIFRYMEAKSFPPLKDMPEIVPRSLLLLNRYHGRMYLEDEEVPPEDIDLIHELRKTLLDAIDDSLQRAIENMRQSTKVTRLETCLATSASTALPQSVSTAQGKCDQDIESHLSAFK